jgi:hypothetical protein
LVVQQQSWVALGNGWLIDEWWLLALPEVWLLDPSRSLGERSSLLDEEGPWVREPIRSLAEETRLVPQGR